MGADDLTLREAMLTQRAIRRLKPDPVDDEVLLRCVELALKAPTGGNAQNWEWIVVRDRAVKHRLAELYRTSWRLYGTVGRYLRSGDQKARRSIDAVQWQVDHFEDVPVVVVPCLRGPRLTFLPILATSHYGSIYPAVWSAMLAARGDGVGSALTSVLAFKRAEVFEVLGVPADEGWIMAACVTFGYPTGRWGVAARTPVDDVSFANRWGAPLGFAVGGPLWPEP